MSSNLFSKHMLTAIRSAIRKDFPAFKEVYKEDSRLMRILTAVFNVFGVAFENYVTTLGYTVFATKETTESSSYWHVLCHEWVHMHQTSTTTKPVFSFLYLFPQSLAILSLLAIVGIWFPFWYLNLFWLLCLLPLPAYFRMRYELEAYTMSLACDYWTHGWISPDILGWYEQQFTSINYYYTWPFKKAIRRLFAKAIADLYSKDYCVVYPFNIVEELIKKLHA